MTKINLLGIKRIILVVTRLVDAFTNSVDFEAILFT